MDPSWLPLPELLQRYCASGGGKTQTVLLAGAYTYLILNNCTITDFNKGDAEKCRVIFWEGQASTFILQKAAVENCPRRTLTSTDW